MSDLETRFHETWLGMVQPLDGLVVSIPVLCDAQCMHRQAPAFQQTLLATCSELAPTPKKGHKDTLAGPRHIDSLEGFLASVLGWTRELYDAGDALPEDLSFYVAEGKQTLRPTLALKRHKTAGASEASHETPAAKAGAAYVALVWDVPDGLSLDKPEAATGSWEYPPAHKFDRLLRQCRVPIGLLTNRRELRLVYAPHGETSGMIRFKVDDMASVGGRPILDAFVMLLSAHRFFGAALEHQLPAILAESRKRQVDVTCELATQVFEALQILLRGFEAAGERDAGYRALLCDALKRDDDHLYGGLLTVLLRLVFVLYAEDRGLLPVDDPLYAESFSVLALFDELQRDQGAYPDSMSRRFGAWPRLLALFRAVFLGCEHGTLCMPERRGELFDPNRFPFLEGWAPEGSAPVASQRERAAVSVPSVDDETLFHVLQKLLLLEGQRLSYRALDVEQIGSVYEALMGYHVRRVESPSVCLKPDRAKAVWVSTAAAFEQPKGRRAAWLKEEMGLTRGQADKLAATLDEAASKDAALQVIEGFRVRGTETAAAGRLVIQPGSERRRTSSHYTPRSLSAPIVEKTLGPLIKVMGDEPASERLLNLKVCDPAMGSGAFLVECCRYLADQVVAAWTRERRLDKIADENEDVVNHARRLVAQRCLYGVDKNPFAVNLAKLSLWLVTLAKDLPFTFVDHALHHGDSLVGLDFEQIKSFHWKPKKQLELCSVAIEEVLGEAIAARQKILSLAAEPGAAPTREKARLLEDAQDAMMPARLIGDLLVGAFFSSTKDKEREKERDRRLRHIETWLLSGESPPSELLAMQQEIRARLPVFHWMPALPEVFYAERPDPLDDNQVNRVAQMDAFVGNPPFAGGFGHAGKLGPEYLAWNQAVFERAHGNADLVAFFFRRCHQLLGEHGTTGFIATNTIGQGDTRASGLQYIVADGAVVYDATKTMVWPGDAAVHVSLVHLAKGSIARAYTARRLDDRVVRGITSQLVEGVERQNPGLLTANGSCSYLGSKIYGQGFVLTPDERDALIAKHKRNAECIFPYLGGEEVNTSPTQSHHRYVINFGQMEFSEAERWPDLLAIVRAKVKPERDLNNREVRKKYWWRFGEVAPALYEALRPLKRCLVTARVTKHLMISSQPTDRVFSEQLWTFPLSDHTPFAVLQSRIHEPWARLLSSSLEDRLRYSASDCFDTFPFPKADPRAVIPSIERLGQKLDETRAEHMVKTSQGLTDTYNQLKDAECHEPTIEKLRELHRELDQAVLAAYGWADIQVPAYTTPTTAREAKAQEAFQDEVIDRLFVLNAERAKAEKLGGAPIKQKRVPAKAKQHSAMKTTHRRHAS